MPFAHSGFSDAEATDGDSEELPIFSLDELLGFTATWANKHYALVIDSASGRAAVLVDELVDEREVLVQSLPRHLQRRALRGTTITPRGELALIVDAASLVERALNGDHRQIWRPDSTKEARYVQKRPRVLVVDDSEAVRRAIEMMLSRDGYAVELAADGIDALAIIQTRPPDLVLLDVEMPEIGGHRVAQRTLRALAQCYADDHADLARQPGAYGAGNAARRLRVLDQALPPRPLATNCALRAYACGSTVVTSLQPPDAAQRDGGDVDTARRTRPSAREQARVAGAVLAGRTAGALSRRLRFGGGASVAGLVALRVDANIAAHLARQLRHGCAVITGTNGKTTTSGMLASALRASGRRVWRNREGANLARGVAASLVIRAGPNGRLRWGGDAAAVFEVDEAAFPQVLAQVRPRCVLVTNLFRDQLDRYGEVDTVLDRWRQAIAGMPTGASVVLNADDPSVASLGLRLRDDLCVAYFGVEDVSATGKADDSKVQVVDTRTCPRCRAVLVFARRFYSHIGHWRCDACGLERPRPSVSARDVAQLGVAAVRFTLAAPEVTSKVTLAVPGLYNVYNALGAVATSIAMGGSGNASISALASFQAAFGRGERIQVGDRAAHLLLAKNPTGMNEVLRALASSGQREHLLLLLNDRAADGEDVSWIWDADFERIASLAQRVTASGTRAYDLAMRLKYAEAEVAFVSTDPVVALDNALHATPTGGTLYIVPTYTALLEVRGELERRGYARRYWE